MNELTVDEVRRALGEKTNARGYRMFSEEGAGAAVRFALQRAESGVSAGRVAEELGLKGWTLQRWLQNFRRGDGRERKGFHRVDVKAAVPAKPVVHGACGVRVDGLSLDEIARLLRELSCSA
jgi:transposase-like protein